MQGKTKGIFEDIFVLLIIAALGLGVYLFFFTEDNASSVSTTIVQSQITQEDKKEEFKESKKLLSKDEIEITLEENQNTQIKKQTFHEEKKPLEQAEVIIEKNRDLNHKNIIQKEIIKETTKLDKEEISKKVDLKILQKFLIETKNKIKNSIVLSSKNNQKKQTLSIRVTILKNGSFEQLIYTGGDHGIFKNNYKNIVSIFPLDIDKSIEDEFPRYLRYSFEFSVKEE